MTKEVQFRRGSSEDHIAVGAGFTGAVAEVTVDTTNNTLRVHDGTTKGGHELVGVAATQHIINKDVVAIGLTVSGISTFGGSVSANQGLSVIGGLDVTYGVTLDGLNVTGISTISVDSSNDALRITQTGSGNALVVEDETNPDATPFVVNANGSVGIGTTGSDGRLLHLYSTLNAPVRIETSNVRSNIAFIDQATTADYNVSIGSYGDDLVLTYTDNLLIRRNADERVLIDSNGNVGIGSTNVTEKLHVLGNIKTSGNILNELGDRFLIGSSSIQTLTSGTSATYTPPANLLAALVIATGAGAGGGGADGTDTGSASGGSGGAAGGTAIRVYNAVEMGASATYTIGAGTAGGTNTGGDSTTGGSTSFTPAGTGTALTANGGAAGQGTATAGNAVHPATVGGTASGGNINITGGDGDGAATADVAEIAQGGTGGGSFWGSGGGGGVAAGAGSDPGDAGHAYGSGGGGAATHDTTTGNVGGAGAGGVIFVLEFTAG